MVIKSTCISIIYIQSGFISIHLVITVVVISYQHFEDSLPQMPDHWSQSSPMQLSAARVCYKYVPCCLLSHPGTVKLNRWRDQGRPPIWKFFRINNTVTLINVLPMNLSVFILFFSFILFLFYLWVLFFFCYTMYIFLQFACLRQYIITFSQLQAWI